MKKIALLVLSFFIVSLTSLTFASAQVSATLKLEPKNPEPRSFVTLTFESYSFNAETATIRWAVDGKTVLEGLGETKLKIKTGEVGETSSITVRASTETGFVVNQSITITPASVVLIYESPKSYVPLFYEGKSLPGEGALIRVAAIPLVGDEGEAVPASKLSYSWYVNDSIFKNASGLGKQSALIRLDYLRNVNKIKVIVRSPLGSSAEKTISVYTHRVMPLVYAHDNILGTDFTKVIDGRFQAVKDFTLSLEPFYVSDEEKKAASFVWYLDGLPSTPIGGRILALRPKEDSYGTKLLSIDVFGTDKRLQKANTKVELIFDTRK